jgi:predicted metal-dependent RNase
MTKKKKPQLIIPDIDEYAQMIIDFTNGTRKPKNKEEQRLYDQIQDIKRKGGIVWIPHEI